MALFLSGYDHSKPGIGLSGLVPPSLPTHHHIPPLPYSELEFVLSPGMSVSNRLPVWVGSLPFLYDPLLPFHHPLFSSFFFFFLGLLNLPSLVRMGPFKPEIGPFHGLIAAHVERCEHSIPGIVLGGLVPPPFRPTPSPSAPIHRRRANRAPLMLGIDLGGLKPLPPAHAPTRFAGNTFGNSPLRTILKIRRPLLRPKTSVGSISAHDITSGSLASSEKGAEDAGAPPGSAFRPSFVLPSAHHWRIPLKPSSSFVRPLFSQSRHRSTAAAGNCGQPFRLRFFSPVPVATLPKSSNTPTAGRTPRPELRRHLSFATRAPSSPELRRHLSFATIVPPSPEFHLSPELRRHLSFATRAPSSPEFCHHLSFATRASPSPEFHLSPRLCRHPSFTTRDPPFSELHLRQRFVVTCRHLSFAARAPPSSELHLSPELHLRLPRLLHSMSFPFKPPPTTMQPFFSGYYHRPRRRRHHLPRQSGNYFTDFCSHAPMGLPLQTATSGEAPSSRPLPPTPASSHSQRRPAGTYFADCCSNRAGRSAPSVRF